MDSIEQIFSMMPDRIPFGERKSPDEKILTPPKIAKEMIEVLPEEVWNSHTTFLDPTCKSGIFLRAIYSKLMETEAVIKDYPDKKERHFHIINNQLYGIAMDKQCQLISMRTAYGQLKEDSHIISLSDYMAIMKNPDRTFLYEVLKKEFNTVKFDVVIGNPPYNNDIYLDFVQLGHKLSSKYTMMITPAKWQAKGGAKNEQFRKEIVPYMSKIAFWADCGEVFEISEVGGISYYLIEHNKCNDKHIKTNSVKNSNLCSQGVQNTNTPILHNEAVEIINKVKQINSQSFIPMITVNKYNLLASIPPAIGGSKGSATGYLLSKDGMLQCLAEPHIEEYDELKMYSGNYKVIYSSKSTEEISSAKSYCYSKFIRFLIFCGLVGNSTLTDETWRFVPRPEAFDHIFTDAELYEKYNLTEEEINIIESVIKERK